MFSDFFVRASLENLALEAPRLRELGLNPEIYVSSESLRQLETSAELDELVASFSANTLHAPFIDLYPGSPDPDVRRVCFEKLRRTMELAARWRSSLVVAHLNYNPVYYSQHHQRWLKDSISFFTELLAAVPGPLLALENVAEPGPERHAEVIGAVADPRLVFCLDLGHSHVFSHLSPAGWLAGLPGLGRLHFHFHDNHGRFDAHLPIGAGSIDWIEVRQTLEQLELPYSVTLEAHGEADLLASLAVYRSAFLPAPVPG